MILRACIAGLALAVPACGQIEMVHPGAVLDPSLAAKHVRTAASFHTPLAEQYIWTANDAAVATGAKQLSQLKKDDWKVEPHDFRASFRVGERPAAATLYIAGPRRARVWLNGTLLAEMQYAGGHHMSFGTMTADAGAALRVGTNTIAVEAVRGGGSHHHTNALKTSWLNSGEVLVVKLLSAPPGTDGKPLAMTDQTWKSAVAAKDGWEQPDFDDRSWKPVASLGGIESSPDFFQWNADAGMYDWPGYLGEAPYMANYRLEPVSTKQVPEGTLLDFGREIAGRLVLQQGKATVRMGESMGELMHAPYLGEIALAAPVGGEVRGPKTGFRYALVQGAAKVIAEGIYYPAPQLGTFESSDPLVNRIFDSAVYTAHLSMQDSILDGIKRDRGRWIGDDEVINRVVLDVYGNVPLVKEGLEDAIGPAPVTEDVNGLPGYSAWWVVAEFEYIVRTGDLEQLRSVTPRMLELLARMAKQVDERHIYAGTGKPFVDWSKGFSTDTPEARRAMHFEYARAFAEAAGLLQLADRRQEAQRYLDLASAMEAAAHLYLKDDQDGVGERWQTNIAAALAAASISAAHSWPPSAALQAVLDRAIKGREPTDVISPYYGSYMLQALSGLPVSGSEGKIKALGWMKSYWGGMLDNGATSFWEAWDPSWAGNDPHAKLEADDKVGYNASLSHGWSSGPAAWLLENVLGVRQRFLQNGSILYIRPELAGMQWIKGSAATTFGAVKVEASEKRVVIGLPAGADCNLELPGVGWSGHNVSVMEGVVPAMSEAHLEGGRSYEFERK